MEAIEQVLNPVETQLKAHFAEAIIEVHQSYDFAVFTVSKSKIKEILQFLKDDPGMEFGFLTTMCGLHFPDLPGFELCLMYQLHNMPRNERIRIKTYMSIDDAVTPSITDLWPTANWMEREAYDFYGFVFAGHPNLKRILNMDEMNYFPMRKEYPLEDGTRNDKVDLFFGR